MLTLHLISAPNPDRGEFFAPAPSFRVEVDNLDQAILVCTEYIEEFDLGAGNWIGGDVYRGEQKISRISYNRRIWSQ